MKMKKTADVLRAENLVRDYVQYGEDGEKKKEIHVLKGLNFFYPETGVCRNYGKIRMWKDDTFETGNNAITLWRRPGGHRQDLPCCGHGCQGVQGQRCLPASC